MKKKMLISAAGMAMIMGFEGLRLSAYQCEAGVWTIGYGSTYHLDGRPVRKGDRLESKAIALRLLNNGVAIYERAINAGITTELTQNQYDVLVSFTFNAGIGNFNNSTLRKLINLGEYEAAAEQLLRWVYVTKDGKKQVSEGLTLRRKKERLVFLKP